ncbi:MAG: Ig-like domain-containing protein [Candidatus Neomarinimicrobiota bacterium]
MNKKGLILASLITFACEDSKDTSPPSVSIISPTESSSVSEIALIQCVASDNDSVRIVELWIDSLATGLTDSSKPYEFYWNTVLLSDSTEYSLMAMAEDMSSNISFSPSINVLVDNTGSNPKSVNIQSITYNETKMTIIIEPSLDNDFLNYKILRSEMAESEKYSIIELTDVNDTIVDIYDFDPVEPSWYWVEVEDIHGYKAVGGSYFILDEYPEQSNLRNVDFIDSTFVINWSRSSDLDFQSYELFESITPEMVDSEKIFETNDIMMTTFNYQIEMNQYRYYQLYVKDYWGLETESEIKMGCSWFLFNNTFGDASYDYGRSLIELNDGGYLIAGNTSLLGDNYSNALLIKIDHTGKEKWKRDYTFSSVDRLNMVKELQDGSLIAAGFTMSSTNYSKDILVIKTDAQGNLEWQRSYGDTQDETANSIDISSDGGLIISGEVINENTGFSLCYLIKIDDEGELAWSNTFGGSLNDNGHSVISTNDAGFAITGMTRSLGDSNGDMWLIKVNANGQMEWERTYGGDYTEYGRTIQQTVDGGYIIIGQTESFALGYNDAYLIKTDAQGNEMWSQIFGGQGTDQGRQVVSTLDEGYLISGYTDSFGTLGGFNFWLVKANSLGELEWQRFYGEQGDDRGLSGIQTSDGGYAIAGYTNSGTSSVSDILFIKTDNNGNAEFDQ